MACLTVSRLSVSFRMQYAVSVHWEIRRKSWMQETYVDTDRQTYTEDVGENIKLLNGVEPGWLGDGSCVWMCEVNDTETHVTQCHWYLCQLGQTERHRTTRCTHSNVYNHISNSSICNNNNANGWFILGPDLRNILGQTAEKLRIKPKLKKILGRACNLQGILRKT